MRFSELFESSSQLLSSLVAQDQKERQEYANFVSKNGGNYDGEAYAKLKGRSSDDIFGERQNLEQLISKSSQFDYSSFSEQDWENLWLLAQHADFNIKFQKQVLSLIEKYQSSDSEQYKYLYDRISCNINGTQKYNTQDVCEPN